MRELAFLLSNYFGFLIWGFILTGLQASLWLNLFGYFPAPYLWIPIICFWTLQRNITESLVMTYLLSYTVFTMSGAPMDMVFAGNILVFLTVYAMKNRVLWSGPLSFVLATGIAAFTMPVGLYFLSKWLEPHPLNEFQFWDWVSRPLLTALFALPLYFAFMFTDHITQKEPPRTAESEGL